MLLWSSLLTLLPALPPGATAAAARPVPIVLACDGSIDLLDAAAAVQQALAGLGRSASIWPAVDAVHAERSCRGPRPDLEGMLSAATRLFYDLDFAAAESLLLRMRDVFRSSGSMLGASDIFAETHMLLGLVALGRDRSQEAIDHLAEIVVALPDWSPDPEVYSPPIRERFADAKASVARQRQTRLSIDSDPPGASVSVAGRPACAAPCELPAVAGRPLYITLRHPDFPLHVGRIVPGGKQAVLALAQDPREQLATGGASALLERLGAGVGLVLRTGEQLRSPVSALVVHAGGTNEHLLDSDGDPRTVAEEIDRLLRLGDLKTPAPETPSRFWWWAGAGALGVAAAGALAYALWPESELRITVVPPR